MTITYYQLAITSSLRALDNLSHLLDKAAEYCAERKVDEKVLLGTRLIPDMFALARQVQLVSDMTKGCAARLTGRESPKMEDTETTIAELKKRLADTAAYLKTFKEADFADSANREVRLPYQPDHPMRGEVFLLQNALPNINFHMTTAYNILRQSGVSIGKGDYLGKVG